MSNKEKSFREIVLEFNNEFRAGIIVNAHERELQALNDKLVKMSALAREGFFKLNSNLKISLNNNNYIQEKLAEINQIMEGV